MTRSLKKPWRATINQNGKQVSVGWFTTEIEAAQAYDAKAKLIFGSYAFANLDDDGFGEPRSERYFLGSI